MFRRPKFDLAALLGAVALTRFVFRSHYLYDVDSVNFALAMGHFDPAVHQPQPPGYFLYVCLGRLVNVIFRDANSALVAISIVASCGAAAMTYILTKEWFGRVAGRFAGLFFLLSPLVWFHGVVALTYIVEAFFSALIGYICWLTYQGSSRWMMASALVLGIAAGVRPSSLLFLGPLFIFSMLKAPRKQAWVAMGALLLAVLAWFVPMLAASGGAAAYFSSLALLWRMSPGRQNSLNSALLLSIVRFFTILGIFVLCFGSGSLLFIRASWTKHSGEAQVRRFTWVWITPALLFFTFVFLRFINGGYLLVVFPPLCAWAAKWAADWYAQLRWPAPMKAALVAMGAALNIGIFVEAPLYCSYRAIRGFEAQLENVEKALPQVANPGQTLLIGFDSHFLGFRHAGYYFPDYRVVEYPKLRMESGDLVFTMQHRDSRLVSRIATQGLLNFVFFPLPRTGDEYRKYLTQLRAKLPSEHLRTNVVGGCEFVSGRAEDLSLLYTMELFPVATGRGGAN